jgi:hypothetical protein
MEVSCTSDFRLRDFTLKTEAEISYETLILTYKILEHHVSEYSYLNRSRIPFHKSTIFKVIIKIIFPIICLNIISM